MDMQNDYSDEGTIPVKGVETLVHDINEFLIANPDEYRVVIAIRDWHLAGQEMSTHIVPEDGWPDYINTWPYHCTAYSWGSGFLDSFEIRYVDYFGYRGMQNPDLSGLDALVGIRGTSPPLSDVLDKEYVPITTTLDKWGVTGIDVCGLAIEVSLQATCLDAVKKGYNTRLLAELSLAIEPYSASEILALLVRSGVKIRL